MPFPEKIVSGGQTGVDRAALDWAIENGIEHGGWYPHGRMAEDGKIPLHFDLTETPLASYSQRTEWNIRDSDATLIVSISAPLSGGSLLTERIAARWHRPCLWICHDIDPEPVGKLTEFLARHVISVLNLAGPRDSAEPEAGSFVLRILTDAFADLSN